MQARFGRIHVGTGVAMAAMSAAAGMLLIGLLLTIFW